MATTPEEVENGGNKAAMYVAWEDLTVVIPNFGEGATKRLLNGVNGCGEPNRILAIMGPSGSGKSTLLDALAGHFSLSHSLSVFLTRTHTCGELAHHLLYILH